MISGFLISYVLVEGKVYPKLKDFYLNRYLRIYPIYFSVALLTLVYSFARTSPLFEIYRNAPRSADILLIFSNIFIFCQDWIMFAGVAGNKLVFTTNFKESAVLLWQGLLVPQAWTLGVELAFYLVAPFVLPRRNIIYLLLALSIVLRIYLVSIGLGRNIPWTYCFFPAELALFLLGALAHQVLLPFYKRFFSKHLRTASNIATYFLIALTILYFLIPLKDLTKTIVLFALFLSLMPLTFIFQNKNKIDKWIGDLSYPIYIGHMLVIAMATYIFEKLGIKSEEFISITCVALTILFAIFLNKSIGAPFEKVRDKFRNSTRKMGVASGEVIVAAKP